MSRARTMADFAGNTGDCMSRIEAIAGGGFGCVAAETLWRLIGRDAAPDGLLHGVGRDRGMIGCNVEALKCVEPTDARFVPASVVLEEVALAVVAAAHCPRKR